jgi:nicotinamide-nucleotide amidase
MSETIEQAGSMKTIRHLGSLLSERKWMLASAESCTGGGLGELLTRVPGSSQWYSGGVISYTNDVKSRLLDVDKALIDEHGAVSEPVVKAMAQGVSARLKADIAVAISGIAGPGGGSEHKPVGSVWLAWYAQGVSNTHYYCFDGGRQSVRMQAHEKAIEGLLNLLA